MASIISLATPEDIEIVQPVINALRCETPNIITDVFKARRSRYKDVRIYSVIDFSTCRQIDLFATDRYNNPINIEIIKAIMSEEGTRVEKRQINLAHIKIDSGTTEVDVKMGF